MSLIVERSMSYDCFGDALADAGAVDSDVAELTADSVRAEVA